MSTSNSSVAEIHNIICKRGDTLLREFRFWTDSTKTTPLDITSYQFKIRVVGNCGNLVFEIGNGLSITAPNILVMTKTPAEMKRNPGVYQYDVQQTVADVVTTIIKGSFTIEKDITA